MRKVAKVDERDPEREARKLTETGWSIHYHVWTQAGMIELLEEARRRFSLTFDAPPVLESGEGTIFVLRKWA